MQSDNMETRGWGPLPGCFQRRDLGELHGGKGHRGGVQRGGAEAAEAGGAIPGLLDLADTWAFTLREARSQ